MAMKRCDFCQESVARSYCQADDAFLCVMCDERVHSANKLASRHRRSPLCKSCGRALKAAAAFESPGIGLCRSCANQPNMIINQSPPDPSSRHCRRDPIPAFVETASPTNPNHVSCLKFDPGPSPSPSPSPALAPRPTRPDISSVVPVLDEQEGECTSDEESVAWLFSDHTKSMDKDLGFFEESFLLSNIFTNCDKIGKERDCVVPVVVPPFPTPNQDTFANHTISCSSLDTGLEPEATTVSETSIIPRPVDAVPVFDPLDREARVLRYKEKRKNRQFAKTIRYASRKAYAEARPRIKGRFVKQPTTAAAETSFTWLMQDESGFGVVPSF